jgi:glycosyltransferase involved in cell wall biosynthesis
MVVPAKAIKDFDKDNLGLPEERIWVIPNGVDVDAFFVSDSKEAIRREIGKDQGFCLAGYIGRLEEPLKGIGQLLAAMAILKSNGEAPDLAIVGTGPSEMELKEQAKHLDLEDRVQFLGVRRDIHRMLKALDILVLPSLREGCPVVILEAMAAGVPVVATRVEGVLELIQHGKTGWLVSPKDPQALAKGIQFMLMNKELADSMAQKAQDWVRTYRSIHVTVQAFASLYDALINSVGTSRGNA